MEPFHPKKIMINSVFIPLVLASSLGAVLSFTGRALGEVTSQDAVDGEATKTKACAYFKVVSKRGANIRTSPSVRGKRCSLARRGKGLEAFGFSGDWVVVQAFGSRYFFQPTYIHRGAISKKDWSRIRKRCPSTSGRVVKTQSSKPSKPSRLSNPSTLPKPRNENRNRTVGKASCGSGKFCQRFTSVWKKCSQGCNIVKPWIAGDRKHCRKRSCHNSRQAIDIHTLNCNGRVYEGGKKDGKPKFNKIAKCLGGYGTTLWNVKNHYGHIHFNFRGCHRKRGCRR